MKSILSFCLLSCLFIYSCVFATEPPQRLGKLFDSHEYFIQASPNKLYSLGIDIPGDRFIHGKTVVITPISFPYICQNFGNFTVGIKNFFPGHGSARGIMTIPVNYGDNLYYFASNYYPQKPIVHFNFIVNKMDNKESGNAMVRVVVNQYDAPVN